MSISPVAQHPRKSFVPLIIGIAGIVLLAGIIAVGLVAYGIIHIGHQSNEQQAMINAYNQRKAAFEAFGVRFQKHVLLAKNYAAVSSDLSQIDLAGCPVDFQEKFVSNIKAWGRYTVEVKSNTGAAGLFRFLGAARMMNTTGLADEIKEGNEAAQAFQDSCLELDQCAREHGMTVVPSTR